MTEEEKEKTEDSEKPPVSADVEADSSEDASEGEDTSEDSKDGDSEEKEDEEAEEHRIINVEGEKKVVSSEGEATNWENERQYFRVFFPDAETPSIVINEVEYQVVDASEKGVKLKMNEGECLLELDQLITAKFTLRTGDSCVVEGKVLRLLPPMVVLLLTVGVPFKLLMSEQRRFVSIYKHVHKD
jgi:hypothetical protein